MREEGFDTAPILEKFELGGTKSWLIRLYKELLVAPRNREFCYSEPVNLAEIHQARPDGPRVALLSLEYVSLYDRIHGGWLGRVAGCVLGKPVEPWGYWGKISEYLQLAKSYPLSNYFPRLDPQPEEYRFSVDRGSCLGEIDGAPEDDDTDYTILALHILETYGLDFSTSDVATEWLSHLSYLRTWTAERTAYRNLVLGIPPASSACVLNPEREYIGARIRADAYGMVVPGKPELAAELAYRDAALSHTKNGIYSAMFTAACIAWAFVSDDIEEIVRVGLSEIPTDCRMAETIRAVLNLRRDTGDWEVAYQRLLPTMAAYHPVHAINNTAWMVLAMLYGDGDFESTICKAVMCGFDTDCNGANAGAVLGILTGADALPGKWTDPLNDTLRTAVSPFGELHISELARRTAELAGKSPSNPSRKATPQVNS